MRRVGCVKQPALRLFCAGGRGVAASVLYAVEKLVALPLWTSTGPAVMTLDGPGGDIVCGGRGVMGFAALILLTGGLIAARARVEWVPSMSEPDSGLRCLAPG